MNPGTERRAGPRCRGGRGLAAALVLLLSAVAAVAGPPADRSDVPGRRHESPAIHGKGIDPARTIAVALAGGKQVRFAADQILLWVRASTPPAEVERLAARLGGRIVGRVAGLNLYQLELEIGSGERLAETLARARAEPVVRRALRNYAVTPDSCPPASDNDTVIGGRRCPLEAIEYYTALAMFEAARPYIALYPVSVAVNDTGLEALNGEFDEVATVNLLDPDLELADLSETGHGTKVCGVIAADNDNAGVNGIASRFLGDRLELLVGVRGHNLLMSAVMAERAALAGADVVNISGEVPSLEEDVAELREVYKELFSLHPDTLFVVAAGNDGMEITAGNHAPGGIVLANVITVGGSAICDPVALGRTSNHGPLVEILAPEIFPTVGLHDGHRVRLEEGTSVSAPQVTAAAAILKAINPDLTPAQLKAHLKLCPVVLPREGGRGNYLTHRLLLGRSIGKLLLGMGVGEPVSGWFFGSGRLAPPLDPKELPASLAGMAPAGAILMGQVASNVCGSFVIEIEGMGQRQVPFTWERHIGGVLDREGSLVSGWLGPGDEESIHIAGEAIFGLGSYVIERHPEDATAVLLHVRGWGRGVEGSLAFDSCWITERHPTNFTPSVVAMSGTLEGVLEDIDGTRRRFEGKFTALPMGLRPDLIGDPIMDHYEANCTGGIFQEE